MSNPMIILGTAILIAASVIAYLWHQKKHKRTYALRKILAEVKGANSDFEQLTSLKNGYFNHFQLRSWEDANHSIKQELKGSPHRKSFLDQTEIALFDSFLNFHETGEQRRKDFNKYFVSSELKLCNTLLSNVEGRSLDMQQRKAVITDEDHNLIIAGAGSGKTTTVVGKVKYLVERWKVDPSKILLLSYTRKSVADLAQRVGITGIHARTFHSLGIKLIAQGTGKRPSIFEDGNRLSVIDDIVSKKINEPSFLKGMVGYFSEASRPLKKENEFKNKGEFYQYLREQGNETFNITKRVKHRTLRTVQREKVKSFQECFIANFLLFHGIRYEYEEAYEIETANDVYKQYYPDFSLYNRNGQRIYLEHYGINREGNCPKYWAEDKEHSYEVVNNRYQEGIKWKRDLHKRHGTVCLETFSYDYYEGKLGNRITEQLREQGFTVKPLPDHEILKIIQKNAQADYKGLIKLLGTFIALWKSNNLTISEIENRIANTEDEEVRQSHNAFFIIAKVVYQEYNKYLANKREIDFGDMINKAAEQVNSGAIQPGYDYIIVDEFQDISFSRYKLIKALLSGNPGSRLFAVGDDWQSIYRFSGSDIFLFSQFEKHFGISEILRIEKTYRYKEPLIKTSGDFIMANESQMKKDIKGLDGAETIVHFCSTTDEFDTRWKVVVFELINLYKRGVDFENKSVLFIGRYGFDKKILTEQIGSQKSPFHLGQKNEVYWSIKGVRYEGQFMTAHSAKGLEADIVFVLNCENGKHGFPSHVADDPVLNLLLSDADQFEHGEERRLFYVAMTRAKEAVYFISNKETKSIFIYELADANGQNRRKCPKCVSAPLNRIEGISKAGNPYVRWDCINKSLGCNYVGWGD